MSLLAAVSASGNSPTTSSIDTTGATLIVASSSYFGTAGTTFTDSKGNTWNVLTNRITGTNSSLQLAYTVPTSVGAGHTFSANRSFMSLCVAAFGDTFLVSPFDQESGAGSTSASTIQPGSITPSQDATLLVSGLNFGTGTDDAESINSGFAIAAQAGDGSANFRGSIAYLYQVSAAAVNPTWTLSANTQLSAGMAVFKQAAAGGAQFPFHRYYDGTLVG